MAGSKTSKSILTSITLIPELYINGIEAIQFKSIQYTPQAYAKDAKQGDFKRDLADEKGKSPNRVDAGDTPIYYRLSPTNVDVTDIDKANIAFYGHAVNVTTRANGETDKNNYIAPVENGISISGNILTINVKRNTTESLYYWGSKDPSQKAKMVSLMVPRVDGTEIYSEFTLLDEMTFSPTIAAEIKGTDEYWKKDGKKLHNCDATLTGHFAGRSTVWETDVTDDTYTIKDGDNFFKYDQEYDLINYVAGCAKVGGEVKKFTVKQLEAYGLVFEFSIPKDAKYNTNADNETDQQEFAEITGSVISSKLPNGDTKNRAAVNKAPIVRVQLKDTKNGNALVDEAYFKVRWVADVRPNLPKKLITIREAAKGKLGCNDIEEKLKWNDFINDVYGQINSEEYNGMSYKEFLEIYTYKKEKSSFSAGVVEVEISKTGTASDADAATWTITQQELGKVVDINNNIISGKDKKVAVLYFESNQQKTYPDLEITWNLNIEVPTKPEITGYNETYWYQGGVGQHDKLYILPVQYNTKDQFGGGEFWKDHVKYEYNLMQAFATTGGSYDKWIVKNLSGDCASWDIQFAIQQGGGSKYHPGYLTWNAGKKAWTGTEPQLNTDELNPTPHAEFGAYKFMKDLVEGVGTEGIRFKWLYDAHKAWSYKHVDPYAILFSDPKENANDKDVVKDLLNPMSTQFESDGWTPVMPTPDDNKAINMKIFARYNAWNVVEIKKFSAYLIEPLRIKNDVGGAFENGHISGTYVDALGNMEMIDFRGYHVGGTPTAAQLKDYPESWRYKDVLVDYYGVGVPEFQTKEVIYQLVYDKKTGNVRKGSVGLDKQGNLINTSEGSTPEVIAANVADGIAPSLEADGKRLIYKNDSGTQPDFEYSVFVPVTINYAFGTMKQYIEIPIYPKGKAKGAGYEVKNP